MARVWAGSALAAVLMCGMAMAQPAQAGMIYWNFGHGCSLHCGLDGPDGNTRTFTASDGATSATVSAWSFTGNANTQLETAFLGRFWSGLGVTNRHEGNGGNGMHTLDNVGRLDIMAFFFSTTIEPTAALLYPYRTGGLGPDSDITVWIGQAAGLPDLAGDTLADLNSAFGPQVDNSGHGSPRWANFGNGSTGNLLLVAGRVSEHRNGTSEDGVKLKKLKAKTVQVPEPASLAVFTLGLLGLGVLARRRRRADVAGA